MNDPSTHTEGTSDTVAHRMSDIVQVNERVPYRVVDRENQGWHGGPDDALGTRYTADYGFKRDLDDRTFEHVLATRGPVRPVEPNTDEDEGELRHLLRQAGRKAVATLAAALESVFHQIREERGGLAAHDSYDFAKRTLMAGRDGSWESELLIELVVFGNGLNLAKAGGGGRPDDVATRRAAGPGPRVDAAVRDQLAHVLYRWVTNPDRYIEVAETLALVVSRYCDATGGSEGWATVADQWLQPGGMAQHDFSVCYRLLYSLSEHFNPTVI
jgi:hypothetical protein